MNELELAPTATGDALLNTLDFVRKLEARAEGGETRSGRDRYEVVGEIGRGGMGRILEVRDHQFGRRVALKEALSDRHVEQRARFLQEAVVTGNLEHPGVAPVYDRGTDAQGRAFYAMRLIEGRTLSAAIAETTTLADRLALVPAVIRVAHTLAYAHERGVVHRDVKPDNVIVGRHGDTVLLDWGIAKVRGSAEVEDPLRDALAGETMVGAVVGTPGYMAPEQAAGRVDAIDERTDVFALGALLFHVLTGRPPYEGSSPQDSVERASRADHPPLGDLAPDAPPAVRAIVERAMAPNPEARFADAAEMAEALEGVVTGSLATRESALVKAVAQTVSVLGVIGMLFVVGLVWHFVSPRLLGHAFYFYLFWPVLGVLLGAIDLVTRGRHRLAPLVIAFMGATLVAGVVGATTGWMMVLEAVGRPAIASDAARWRELVSIGGYEAMGHVPLSATLFGVQLVLWSLAKRASSPRGPVLHSDRPSNATNRL